MYVSRSLWTLVLAGYLVTLIEGHGRLVDPPSRSSMWRMGYNTPTNYNDNQLYCGGFMYQQQHGGKCGICGDPIGSKKENEAGGRYATGIIAKKYKKGQTITIDIQVTANHNGWFEFRLCPNNNVKKPATQNCLDRHLLELADGTGTRWNLPNSNVGHFKSNWKLPRDVVCSQCVLQWKWHVANSWGVDPDGKSGIGYGPQEEFYGCSDVEIVDDKTVVAIHHPNPVVVVNSPPSTSTTTTTPKPTTTTPKPTTTSTTPKPSTTTTTTPKPTTTTTTPQPTTTVRPTVNVQKIIPSTIQKIKSTAKPSPLNAKKCRSVGIWTSVKGMNNWCVMNCARGYCPGTHCICQ